MDFGDWDCRIFELFDKRLGLVTAGEPGDFNTCTVGWGELGTLWDHRPVATVFIHPSRYTSGYLERNGSFTLSFYGPEQRKALGYLGTHSGRDGDKVAAAGLTPVAFGDSVTFQEAELTFLCRKLYLHHMSKEALADEVKDYYASMPLFYANVTPDGTGDAWEAHYAIIGEIVEAKGELA